MTSGTDKPRPGGRCRRHRRDRDRKECDLVFELHHGIGRAASWRELEGWISQTRAAFERGVLAADLAEQLTKQGIQVSRRLPEQ